MRKVLVSFHIFVLFLAFLCSFMFVGCGEKRSQEEISTVYKAVLDDYEKVEINYSNDIQTLIDNANSGDLFYNLRDSGNGAIFEPVLMADLKAVDYFIYWPLNYSKVPTKTMNSIFADAKNFRASLKTLQETKEMLENASNPQNWVGEYKTKLYNTMVYYNAFVEKYLTIFEKYVDVDTSLEGRVSTSKMQLDFSKKLLESAKIITQAVAKDYLKTAYTEEGENCCVKMNQLFDEAVVIYKTDEFHAIINASKTAQEDALITYQNRVSNYTLYQNNFKTVEKLLKNHSIKEMRNKQLNHLSTQEEDAYLSKVNEFLKQDVKVMFDDYMANLVDALKSWKDNNIGD